MGKMNMGKFNDIVFAAIFIWHLSTRQWPTGGTLQTVLDVMLVFCAILIGFKYYMEHKKGNEKAQTTVKENKTSKIILSSKKRKRK
ncbi:MAG: hypothetical protein H6Q70_1823 [Firmicutes bacterium]|nr:hypothetical protein [Bacillota bacterium]